MSTNADFANGATEVVAGAQVNDKVTYEGLVPGKEYTLKAELISKVDGKTVLGEGHKTFTPDAAKGEVVVEITVDESVTEPVEAAVAFEELTSVEVNDKGEETPGTDSEKPNHIADHKDINDKNQTVPKPKNPGNGGSSKSDWPWWLLLIPGLGIVKIITDGHDGGHNGGHDGGNSHNDVTEDKDRDTNAKDENVEDTGHGDRGDSALDATAPEDAGQPLPSNAERVDIKSVPSGATKLDSGMQSYIK
ncbi:VaFE repeat-containing surface-anchored protein [Corynebacterium sp. YSMAA1_1_D6]|uniref:VaFE repeat-containing surface-anchored protein n=1 Tax=Corynebacterium sp. YSMAA1_1_D6 TaxID=3383589 RepID=UPI0038CF3DD3